MIAIERAIGPGDLRGPIERVLSLSASKIRSLMRSWTPSRGAPVFTVDGLYTSRGWTEWTQGFMFGSALLQFDATGEKEFLDIGRKGTAEDMAPHVSATGVHDHGFNNVSTYGNLYRMMCEDLIPANDWELKFYAMALRASGAVQASRWTDLGEGAGYIFSFNGPHSLFADTVRSLRSLALAHRLGHVLMGERDAKISLLGRLIRHAEATAKYNVYYGEGRDIYDVRGRVAHESVFNTRDGSYRCPSSQQGYSPFTTWTRGLAWIICGFAEEAEFIASLSDEELAPWGGRPPSSARSSGRRKRPRISTSTTPPPTAFRTGTPARPGSRGSATTSAAPPIRSTARSRSTVRPRRSRRRGSSGWGCT